MTNLKGGYILVNKNDANIYASVENALTSGKPVLFYEDANTCYYIDTISKSGSDVVLTKGGKTITITDANVVTEVGAVNGAILDDIVDAKGNNRFIEGDGTALTLEGLDITYNKWSLSGTHLMFVIAGNIANGTEIIDGVIFSTFTLPEWIIEKIYPVWSNYVENKTLTLTASDWLTQTTTASLAKRSGGITIEHHRGSSLTLTADRGFRLQFDLLIDNENE